MPKLNIQAALEGRAGEKPKKGKKKKKDPEKPKRALSAYMFYSNERRPTLKARSPELPFGEYAKIIGAEWREMDEATREKYVEMANDDKERYAKALRTYERKKKLEKKPKPEPLLLFLFND